METKKFIDGIKTKISINLYIDIDYNICYHIIVANDEYINWKRGIKLNIEILWSYKNNVLIKDLQTGYIWLYSYNKPIAYYDGKIHICSDNLTQASKFHMAEFKKYLKEEL